MVCLCDLTRHVEAKNTGQQWSKNMRKSLIINERITLTHPFSRRRWQKPWRNTIRSRNRTRCAHQIMMIVMIISYEMTTEHNTSGAFALLLSFDFKCAFTHFAQHAVQDLSVSWPQIYNLTQLTHRNHRNIVNQVICNRQYSIIFGSSTVSSASTRAPLWIPFDAVINMNHDYIF